MGIFNRNKKGDKKKVDKKSSDEKEMSFVDHLEELRWHIVRALAAIAIVGIVAFIFKSYVFDYIIFGPRNHNFPTYKFFCGLSERMCFTPADYEVVPIQMGEQFFTAIKVCFWLGLIVSFPLVFNEIWKFVKPGLYDNEKKVARGVVFVCSFLFLLGVTFGYFVIAPYAIDFLITFDIGLVTPQVSVASYVNYMTMFTIPTGILFQLPIFVHFLSLLGLLTPEIMRKYRRHAFIVILVIAAVATPPDVISQFLVGVPVFLLYEISIGISRRATKKYQEGLKD